jgi:hypothetical protein
MIAGKLFGFSLNKTLSSGKTARSRSRGRRVRPAARRRAVCEPLEPRCLSSADLLTNGDFSDNSVSGRWDIFYCGADETVPADQPNEAKFEGWEISGPVELWSSGWVELDADENGPKARWDEEGTHPDRRKLTRAERRNEKGSTYIRHNLNPELKTAAAKGQYGPTNSARSAVWDYDADANIFSWSFTLDLDCEDFTEGGSVDIVLWYSDALDYPQQKDYYNVGAAEGQQSPTVMRPIPIIVNGITLRFDDETCFTKEADIAATYGSSAESRNGIDYFTLVEQVTGDTMRW